MFYKTLILISAFSFLFYSIRSIVSKNMINEYSRWGFAKLRVFISSLQFIAGIGLILGIYNLTLLAFTSLLLTIMMIVAVIVRIKIKDSLLESLPAIFYTILNFTILYVSFLRLS